MLTPWHGGGKPMLAGFWLAGLSARSRQHRLCRIKCCTRRDDGVPPPARFRLCRRRPRLRWQSRLRRRARAPADVTIGTADPGFSEWRKVTCSVFVRRAGLLLSQQDFEWRWSVPLFQCLTVLEFSFILFDLCLLITFFNFIMNYVPIVTFWIFTYHKIWILSIMFCFIWSYWIIYFLACL